jgi:retron-type reverse transcriptase
MVTPIFKKGSTLDVSNYRPISLLSNLERLFEKLMYSRLVEFLERHNSFYPNQCGFRLGHSTTHALAGITNRIFNSLDECQFACGIFVDLQKAFDAVDHKIIIKNYPIMVFVAFLTFG